MGAVPPMPGKRAICKAHKSKKNRRTFVSLGRFYYIFPPFQHLTDGTKIALQAEQFKNTVDG